jgi:hypothetical protein
MDLHRKDISDAAKNTCEWLCDEPGYKDWLARSQRLLWIVGIPGSGKSTLMKYIYQQDTLRMEPNENKEQPSQQDPKVVIVASFFCYSTGTSIQKSRSGLFRSLLHQILQQIPTLPPEVTSEFNKKCELQGEHKKKWDWHERELEKMLQISISYIALAYPDKYVLRIFVDALDEFSSNEPSGSKGPKYLTEYFQSLASPDILGIDQNICISCRDYPFIAKGGLRISIGNKNHQDISTYVRAKLSGITGEGDDPRDLVNWIATKASGIFQWAVVVTEKAKEFNEDMGIESPKRILKQLEHLPQGLDELYKKSFQSLDRPRRLQSLRLLRWICFAQRPLSVKELYVAMESDPSSMPWLKAVDCEINEMANRIKSSSCNLAAIIEHEGQEGYSTVEPRHQSVYDYLVSSGLQYLDDNALGANPPISRAIGHAHLQLSRYCVKYLSSKKALTKCRNLKLPEHADRIIGKLAEKEMEEKDVARLEDEFPFIRYAVSAWAYHANVAEDQNPDQEGLLKFYQELINIPFKKLGPVRIWIVYEGRLRLTTLLHIASERHLTRLAELILQSQNNLKNASVADDTRQHGMPDNVGINMAIHGFMYETPLQLAARQDHVNVVELLLQHRNIDVNVQDRYGLTALMHAVISKREEPVGMLLQHSNIDVTASDQLDQTALFRAVRTEHEGIFTMLLQHRNIDVNAEHKYSGTALFIAAQKGLEGMVRVLLETRKADIKISPTNWAYDQLVGLILMTPLIVAVEKGHWAIVELLLKFRGRMSEPDKQVARALEKLPPEERSNMSEHARRYYWKDVIDGQEVIAKEQVQFKLSSFFARRYRFLKNNRA